MFSHWPSPIRHHAGRTSDLNGANEPSLAALQTHMHSILSHAKSTTSRQSRGSDDSPNADHRHMSASQQVKSQSRDPFFKKDFIVIVDCVVSSRWEDRTRSKRPLSPVSISTSKWPTTSLLRQPKAFTTSRNSSNWQQLSQVSCHSFSSPLPPSNHFDQFLNDGGGENIWSKVIQLCEYYTTCVTEN